MKRTLAAALACAVAWGCSPAGRGPRAASTSAGAQAQPTPAAPLEVRKAAPVADGAVFTFSDALDPGSAAGAVVAYRELDADVGGAFEPIALDAQVVGASLRLVAREPLDRRELRVALRATLRSAHGESLVGGAGSTALTFAEATPDAVYELRFRARPRADAASARSVQDDHGADPASATPLTDRAQGTIETAGDRDWFRVDLPAGQPVVLRTETSGDTVLTLYAADGQAVVGVNDDAEGGGRHSRLALSASGGGVHLLEVAGFGQTTPTYAVVVEGAQATPADPGADPASATPLAPDQQARGTLGPRDQDWYRLDLPAGELTAEVDHPDVTLMLLDAQGLGVADPVHVVAAGETLGRIGADYGIPYQDLAALNAVADPDRIAVGDALHVPATGVLRVSVTTPGRYHLRLQGFAGATPSYTLSVRHDVPSPPTPAPGADDHGDTLAAATPLALGGAAAGAIEAGGDVDVFGVDLTAGQTYELVVGSAGDTVLELLDAGGSVLGRNDDDPQGGRGSRLVWTAARTDRYALRVTGYGQTTPRYVVEASERQPGVAPDPSRFRQRSNTDVWHIDFALRADLFAADLAAHGLRSGDAETDRLARDRVIEAVLSHLSRKYGLDADGNAVPAVSWKISFTAAAPAGRPGRNHSREAVGGEHEDGSGTLGVSYLDPGNRRREDNDDLGELGIFSASIWGRDSRLRPGLRADDRRYLDGTYRLGDGTSSDDARFRRVRSVIDDWGHALGVVTAHEVGHSVGLEHDESSSRGIMRPALSSYLLSDDATAFATPSADTLTRNLGNDP